MLMEKRIKQKYALTILLFFAMLLSMMKVSTVSAQENSGAASNPMGRDTFYLSRYEQLGISGIQTGGLKANYGQTNILNLTLDLPISYGMLSYSFPTVKATGSFSGGNTPAEEKSLYLPKDTVAADLDGDGIQELIEASYEKQNDNIMVGIYMVDADGNKRQIHDWKDDAVVESGYHNVPIHIAAFNRNNDARDELIVAVGTTVYIFTGTSEPLSKMRLSWLETINLRDDKKYTYQGMSNTSSDRPSIELISANVYGNALNEAILINGSSDSRKDRSPVLVVLGNEGEAVRGVELKLGNNESFISPNVDVGDVYGTGQKMLVIGGRTTAGNIKYAIVDPDYLGTVADEKYPALPTNGIETVGAKELSRIESYQLGLKCAALRGKTADNTASSSTAADMKMGGEDSTAAQSIYPESIIIGGSIYTYDKTQKKFVHEDVYSYFLNGGSNDSFRKRSEGNMMHIDLPATSKQWLNHVNVHDVIAGNFMKNAFGKEQVIILFSLAYDNNKSYMECIATCEMSSEGKLVTKITEMFSYNDSSSSKYASICNIDTLGKGHKMVFQYAERVKSEPAVMAVLGATPHYEEFVDQYQSLGDAETTYGMGQSKESSNTNGVSGALSASFGFEQDITCIVKLGSFAVKTEIEDQFSTEWTKRKKISFETSFKSYYEQDSVVVMTVPYDIFYYKIQNPENGDWKDTILKFPSDPVIEIMPLEEYHAMIARDKTKNAPRLPDAVLKHTVGDPRTYPSSLEELDTANIVKSMTGSGFLGAGIGSTVSEQKISVEQAESKVYRNEFSVRVSVDVNVLGVTAGAAVETGYINERGSETGQSTMYSGSVAGLPRNYSNYGFRWSLAVYDYKERVLVGSDAKGKDIYQDFTYIVVSYLVKPEGNTFPPRQVKGLAIAAEGDNINSTTLTWEAIPAVKNSPVTEYRVLRSEFKGGPYGQIASVKTTSLIDANTFEYGKTYYYKVVACNNFEGVASQAIERKPVLVNALAIHTSPNLVYSEKDQLNLSNMVVRLTLSNLQTMDVSYGRFSEQGLTASLSDQQVLTTKDTGKYITITHSASGKQVNTKGLKVGVISDADLTAAVEFSVGARVQATELKANETLRANITLTNASDQEKQVMVILALYDGDNTMVGMSSVSEKIGANASLDIERDLMLPANVNNHSVKIMIWDGSDFDDTKQIPLVRTIEF